MLDHLPPESLLRFGRLSLTWKVSGSADEDDDDPPAVMAALSALMPRLVAFRVDDSGTALDVPRCGLLLQTLLRADRLSLLTETPYACLLEALVLAQGPNDDMIWLEPEVELLRARDTHAPLLRAPSTPQDLVHMHSMFLKPVAQPHMNGVQRLAFFFHLFDLFHWVWSLPQAACITVLNLQNDLGSISDDGHGLHQTLLPLIVDGAASPDDQRAILAQLFKLIAAQLVDPTPEEQDGLMQLMALHDDRGNGLALVPGGWSEEQAEAFTLASGELKPVWEAFRQKLMERLQELEYDDEELE